VEIISAKNIIKQHPTGYGVNGISLSVYKGQSFGVLGANGSGKTTLTRLIAGLDRIQQGNLCVLGHSIYPHPIKLRCQCGIALDTPAHWESLSGRQNLMFFARQYGLASTILKQHVDELLIQADLMDQADDPISAYSFGMRRKLNIIAALAHDPELLILDEPSAGVDMAFLDQLAQWIQQRREKGKTTWIADNDADWLERTATDVICLSNGQVQAKGSVQELMESVDAQYRIMVTLGSSDLLAIPSLSGISNYQCKDNHISADLSDDSHLPVELLQWITAQGGHIRTVEVHSVTLHEALGQHIRQMENAV
jgi:ABC-2 type transport system ATP-binding protein